MAIKQVVVLVINNEEFGIDIEHVNIIERTMEIYKIPNTPDYIEGLVNLRGKVHTVLNLRKRFGMPAKEVDDNTKIIMVDTGTAVVGFIVDEVREIVKIDDKDMESAPNVLKDLKKSYITGVAKLEQRMIMLLDPADVLQLPEQEKAAVS